MTNVNIDSGNIEGNTIHGTISNATCTNAKNNNNIKTIHSPHNQDYAITFVSDYGNQHSAQQLYVDSGNGIRFNPQTNTLTTTTLNVTNIGGFAAQGGINFNHQSMTNVNIDSGTGIFSRLEAHDDNWTQTGATASFSGTTLQLNMNNDMVQSQTINITNNIHKINVNNGRDGCQLIVSATFNENHTIYGGPSTSRDGYETSNVYIGFKDDIAITDHNNQRVVFSIIKCHGKYYVTGQQYWYT